MLRIAAHYDHLAKQAEEHRKPFGKSTPSTLAGRAALPPAAVAPVVVPVAPVVAAAINPFGSQAGEQPVAAKA
jgi:hypothetical protein